MEKVDWFMESYPSLDILKYRIIDERGRMVCENCSTDNAEAIMREHLAYVDDDSSSALEEKELEIEYLEEKIRTLHSGIDDIYDIASGLLRE